MHNLYARKLEQNRNTYWKPCWTTVGMYANWICDMPLKHLDDFNLKFQLWTHDKNQHHLGSHVQFLQNHNAKSKQLPYIELNSWTNQARIRKLNQTEMITTITLLFHTNQPTITDNMQVEALFTLSHFKQSTKRKQGVGDFNFSTHTQSWL